MGKFVSFKGLARFKDWLDIAFGLVDDALGTKQDTLVSGTNIKTINNQPLLGEGNIEIQGGGADAVKYTEQTLTDVQKEQARTNIDAASKTPVVTQSASVAIEPNKITNLGNIKNRADLTLAAGETGKANIYDFIFTLAGGWVVPLIVWPSGISWAGGAAPTLRNGKTYEVSISEGLAVIIEY